MSERDYTRLCRIRCQRELSDAEQAALHQILQDNPALQADWQLEQQVNATIARIGVPPVASNFTSQVLQSLPTAGVRSREFPIWRTWWAWIRGAEIRIASVAGLLLLSGMFTWYHHQQKEAFRIESLAAVSGVVDLPDVAALQDFEIIKRLGSVPVAPDTELLLALD